MGRSEEWKKCNVLCFSNLLRIFQKVMVKGRGGEEGESNSSSHPPSQVPNHSKNNYRKECGSNRKVRCDNK